MEQALKKEKQAAAEVPAIREPDKKQIRLRAFQQIAHPKKRRLLVAYVEDGTLRGAARLAGIDWRMHYNWIDADPQYAEAFQQAKTMAADRGEDIVYERAFAGYDKPVTYEGQITATYKQPSDLLAMFWLKGARPDKYREDSRLQINVNVPPAVNIVPAIDITEESEED
jgi:hypothetical protein